MKKIYHLALMLMAFFALASCTPTVDDVFDKSSAERISTTTDENMQVLTSLTSQSLSSPNLFSLQCAIHSLPPPLAPPTPDPAFFQAEDGIRDACS